MLKRITLVFAMPEEAAPYISNFNLTKEGKHYKGMSGDVEITVIISGIGKINALLSVIGIVTDYIFNIGSCGGYIEKARIGNVVVPDSFYDGDFDLSMFGINTKDPGINLELSALLFVF